jgi:hypothetical protein
VACSPGCLLMWLGNVERRTPPRIIAGYPTPPRIMAGYVHGHLNGRALLVSVFPSIPYPVAPLSSNSAPAPLPGSCRPSSVLVPVTPRIRKVKFLIYFPFL